MFSNLHTVSRSDADMAQEALNQEGSYRFPAFSASDAVTLVRAQERVEHSLLTTVIVLSRDFHFANAFVPLIAMQKARVW